MRVTNNQASGQRALCNWVVSMLLSRNTAREMCDVLAPGDHHFELSSEEGQV
jgi:hypothetical protein